MKVKKESIDRNSRLETLKTPEIFVQKENGAQLLSVILKGKYPEWGDVDGTISR